MQVAVSACARVHVCACWCVGVCGQPTAACLVSAQAPGGVLWAGQAAEAWGPSSLLSVKTQKCPYLPASSTTRPRGPRLPTSLSPAAS